MLDRLVHRVQVAAVLGTHLPFDQEVANRVSSLNSLAPYERRVIELLRNSKDKRARKLAKKRVCLNPLRLQPRRHTSLTLPPARNFRPRQGEGRRAPARHRRVPPCRSLNGENGRTGVKRVCLGLILAWDRRGSLMSLGRLISRGSLGEYYVSVCNKDCSSEIALKWEEAENRTHDSESHYRCPFQVGWYELYLHAGRCDCEQMHRFPSFPSARRL